jgi:spore maturation protein CgeB
LNIFVSFLQGKRDHPIPAYSFWEFYIKKGIEEAGHTWVECNDVDWAEGLVDKPVKEQAKWKDFTWSKTIKFLRDNRVDLFLGYLYPQQIDCSAIYEIKKLGIPTVNFFCDHVREFTQVPIEFAAFDLNWVPEKKALKMYDTARYPYLYLPMPVWIHPDYRMPHKKQFLKQLTFIGSHDIQRQIFFEEVLSLDPMPDLVICGNGWISNHSSKTTGYNSFLRKVLNQLTFVSKHGLASYRRKLSQRNLHLPFSENLRDHIGIKPNFEQYIALTRESSITVGINRYPSFRFPLDQPDTYSRLRDIEAPMLGACYLTEYTTGLEDLYDLEKDIQTYSSAEDFVFQVGRLLKDDDKKNQLRESGQRVALTNLSIPATLKKIQTTLR